MTRYITCSHCPKLIPNDVLSVVLHHWWTCPNRPLNPDTERKRKYR